MTSHPVAVTARGWGWRHATRAAWALRGLDLTIEAGERVMLLGPSGSGKSTLLAGLAGLLHGGPGGTGDEEGVLALDGVPARQARRQGIGDGVARTGLLLQDPIAQTVLARCGDDVAFGLENHAVPREEIWPRVRSALEAVGFRYGPAHPTSRLSGGERQRLALAGVLALRPGLLLLDEPTAMLDPDGAAMLRAQVAAVLAGGAGTCVVVEHRVGDWVDLVDRVVVLARAGGVVADGPPDRVLEEQGESLARQGVWVPHRPPVGRVTGGRPARRPGGDRPTPEAPALLRARRVAVRRAPTAPPAVRDVDVQVSSGRALCVVGPNGSGKSSLALALAGLLPPSTGDVLATARLQPPRGGARPHEWRPRDLVRRIGTVFQEPQLQFVTATCAEELAVGPRRIGLDESEVSRRVADLLDRLHLTPLARANPFTLSGGEQRRLSVATVLATQPSVLVLDEPTFGQDARTWAELVDLLAALRTEGAGIVAVTHDRLLVEALADQVLHLADGRPVPGPAGEGRAGEPAPISAVDDGDDRGALTVERSTP